MKTAKQSMPRLVVITAFVVSLTLGVGCSGGGSTSAPAKPGDAGGTAPPPKQVRTPSP